jgi:hypothetical protein
MLAVKAASLIEDRGFLPGREWDFAHRLLLVRMVKYLSEPVLLGIPPVQIGQLHCIHNPPL